MNPLVLGLGNDLLCDDGVGLVAARRLAKTIADRADVHTSSMHGLALIDFFIGYERAIVIDAMQTGIHPPGTVIEMDMEDLRTVPGPSPHYTGLPEMRAIAQELNLPFPATVKIVAVEIADAWTVREGLNPVVQAALDEIGAKVTDLLQTWSDEKRDHHA